MTHLQWLFRDNYRYMVLLVGFLLTTSLSINMSTLNFTLICMVKGNDSTMATTHSTAPVYSFSERQKAFLMWAVAVGTLAATLPFSALSSNYGARYPLFGATVISAIATALIPIGAEMGMGALMALRVVQGVSYSADFTSIGLLTSSWSALAETGIFLSVLSCFTPASAMVTNVVSAWLCSTSMGWPLVYYTFSLSSLALAFIWLFIYSDEPQFSMCVSPVELETIQRGKSAQHIDSSNNKYVPYGAILRCTLIWIIWLNAFADLCSGVFISMYQPQYFAFVLNYSVADTGLMTGSSSAIHIILKLLSGIASDRVKFLSERTKMIICNTIAVGLPGAAYLGITYSPTPFIAFLCIVLNAIFFSTAGGGFYKCAALCSRQYSHFVLAVIQINKVVSMFLGPAMMAFFVSDITDALQWRPIFWIFAILCFITAALFCYWATDEPADFTNTSDGGKVPTTRIQINNTTAS